MNLTPRIWFKLGLLVPPSVEGFGCLLNSWAVEKNQFGGNHSEGKFVEPRFWHVVILVVL
jgi:hypothetical protein